MTIHNTPIEEPDITPVDDVVSAVDGENVSSETENIAVISAETPVETTSEVLSEVSAAESAESPAEIPQEITEDGSAEILPETPAIPSTENDDNETENIAEIFVTDTVNLEEESEAEAKSEPEKEEGAEDLKPEDKAEEISVPSKETAEIPEEVDTDSDEADSDEDGIEPVEMLSRDEMRQAIYALLFVSDRPLSAPRIAEALGDVDKDIVLNMLEELKEEIQASDTPYILKEIAGGYQLITKAAYAPFIRRLLQIKKSKRLSKAVLETLAIIAYKQPVTRADVESIRGVSVSYAFDLLQEKRMIKVAGVADLPGRPKLYKTTDEFLVHFGLNTLKELPSLEELRELS